MTCECGGTCSDISHQHSPRIADDMFVCPPPPKNLLSLETRLCVGFGYVTVRCDEKVVWRGDNDRKKLRSVERQARRESGRWTVEFYAPLSGATYERRGRDTWELISTNEGFA